MTVIHSHTLFDVSAIEAAVTRSLDKGSIVAVNRWTLVVLNFRGNRNISVKRLGAYAREITPDHKEIKFVDFGTKVRRALMSRDFIAKTSPSRLASRRGRGGVVFISKKLRLPGIKARKFSEKIQKTMDREFPAIVSQELERIL